MSPKIAETSHPVPLRRRLLARLLDAAIYGSAGAVAYALTDIEFVREPAFAEGLLLLYCADQLVGGSRFGCSTSQWLCGYVVTRPDGSRARVGQQIGRLLTFLSLGWLSLFTSPFRRDRAGLHDLLTGTRAYRSARRPRRTGLRLALVAGCMLLSGLYGLSRALHVLYEIKVLPVEIAIEEAFGGSLDSPSRAAEAPFVFQDVVLLDAASLKGEPEVCRSADDPQHYRLDVDGERFELVYLHAPRPVFGYTNHPQPHDDTLEAAELPYVGPFALWLSGLPWSPASHEVARLGPDGSLPEFPVLSPVDNLSEIVQRVIWIVSVPSVNRLREKYGATLATRSGSDHFAVLSSVLHDRFVDVTFNSTSDGVETRLDLSTRNGNATTRRIARNAYATLTPARAPAAPIPDCGPDRLATASGLD